MRSEPDGGGPPPRTALRLALALGAAAVVGYELWQLLHAAVTGPGGMDRGAVWAILLMILVTFLTVGGIGYGLSAAMRDSAEPTVPDENADRAAGDSRDSG